MADGADRSIRDLDISNVNVEHVGGIGLDVLGNVQGTVFNSWMHGNGQGGARFANSAGGGVASDLEWVGGGFRKNGVAGLILDNGAHDLTVKGAYFVDNDGPGIQATSGITLVCRAASRTTWAAGAIVGGPASFVDVTFSTWGPQTVGIGGYLAGGQVEPDRRRQRVLRRGRRSDGAGQPAGQRHAGDRRHRQCRGRARHRAWPAARPSSRRREDTTAPVVSSITASGAGIVAGAGDPRRRRRRACSRSRSARR